MAADPQAILIVAALEFFHVSGEVVLQLVEPEADVAPQLLWQTAKLQYGIVAKFNPVTHSQTMGMGDLWDKNDHA